MVDPETPDAKKNGTGGTLIKAHVKVIPYGPAGPFELDGTLIAVTDHGPEPVAKMTFRADSLGLIEHGLRDFQNAYRAAMKGLADEMKAAQLIQPASADMVRRIKGS